MKKFRLRDYLPVLIMVLCAAIFGVLLATGVMDLDTVPQMVADRPVLAVLVVLGLYVLKGFSGVVVYNALVVVVSMVLPLPAALAVNGVGTAVCLSISYAMGAVHQDGESGVGAGPASQDQALFQRHAGIWLCHVLRHPYAGAEHGGAGTAAGDAAGGLPDVSGGVVAGHCAGDGLSGHRRKFAGFQFAGVLDLSGNQHGTGGMQRGVHPAKAPGRQS